MSKETQKPKQSQAELPIERGYPLEQVNKLAERETRGREHYKPIYTMHKWWARRTGAVFRTICLYSLLDDTGSVSVSEPGSESPIDKSILSQSNLKDMLEETNQSNPDPLWNLYNKNVSISNKKVLDPFVGGGTSLIEASRLGAEVTGIDLNPVAWFVSKKESEASDVDIDAISEAFDRVEQRVKNEITQYYTTSCPNNPEHDADVMYYFWVKELDCISCGRDVSLFNDYRVGKGRYDKKGSYNVFCPNCNSLVIVDDWRSDCQCDSCGFEYIPQNGNVKNGKYSCSDCGQKYRITDAIDELGKPTEKLYALEYYCTTCEDSGSDRSQFKGYKETDISDRSLFESAVDEWEESKELNRFVPNTEIRPGWKTNSSAFTGNAPGAGDLKDHGIRRWVDMFNERQLLSLSKLFRAIDEVNNQEAKEYLSLAASESLKHNSKMSIYNSGTNAIINIFKSNSFDPPTRPVENNLWEPVMGPGRSQPLGIWFSLVSNGQNPLKIYS